MDWNNKSVCVFSVFHFYLFFLSSLKLFRYQCYSYQKSIKKVSVFIFWFIFIWLLHLKIFHAILVIFNKWYLLQYIFLDKRRWCRRDKTRYFSWRYVNRRIILKRTAFWMKVNTYLFIILITLFGQISYSLWNFIFIYIWFDFHRISTHYIPLVSFFTLWKIRKLQKTTGL